MNPVTQYVKEVERSLSGPNLLKGGRLKTSAMIYKALSNKVDALEVKLGREPTDLEMAALLADFGAPADVATRYSQIAAQTPSHDLLERYLAAVERRLPKEQAADIVAELREAIDARIDAKSDGLGRGAGPDEVAAILKEFGHPTLVAARYGTQQYLIGPSLYPWFWPAQRTAIGIALVVLVVLTVIRVFDSARPMAAFIIQVLNWWEPLAMVFGLVTLAFMVMERTQAPVKLVQAWNPKTLPHDNVRRPKSLFDSVFSLGFDAIFILWWVGVISFPDAIGREGRSIIVEGTAAWDAVQVPVLVLAIVTAAVHAADLVYPAWSRLRSAVSIVAHVGGLAVIWVLMQSRPLLQTTMGPGADENLRDLLPWPEYGLTLMLWIAAVAWAVGLGWEVWRQIRATHPVRPIPTAGAPA